MEKIYPPIDPDLQELAYEIKMDLFDQIFTLYPEKKKEAIDNSYLLYENWYRWKYPATYSHFNV